MIIGNGLLAKSFKNFDSNEFLIFVSGVSNSLETKPSEFMREETLLRSALHDHPEKKLIYYSTSSIHDASKKWSLYVLHKLKMERIIQENAEDYIIYRVGNVIGKGGNENTLFNFLVRKIKNHQEFYLHKNAKRPLIDVDDIAQYYNIDKNRSSKKIVDISYPYQYTLEEIVTEIENFLNIKSLHVEVDEGEAYNISFAPETHQFFQEKNHKYYLAELIKKYAN